MKTGNTPVAQLEQAPLTTTPKRDRFSIKAFVRQRLKTNVAIAGGLLGMSFLVISNPSSAAYLDYAVNRSDKFLTDQCESFEGTNFRAFGFGIPLTPTCKGLAHGSSSVTRPIISMATEPRQNYGLFSIYITDIRFVGTFKTIGIANQFITFDISEP